MWPKWDSNSWSLKPKSIAYTTIPQWIWLQGTLSIYIIKYISDKGNIITLITALCSALNPNHYEVFPEVLNCHNLRA